MSRLRAEKASLGGRLEEVDQETREATFALEQENTRLRSEGARVAAQLGDAARQRERDGVDATMLRTTNEKLQRELQDELVAGTQLQTQLGRAEAMVATLEQDKGRLEDQMTTSEAATDRQLEDAVLGASSTIDSAREAFQAETAALRSKVKHLEQQLSGFRQDVDTLKDEKVTATSRARSETRQMRQALLESQKQEGEYKSLVTEKQALLAQGEAELSRVAAQLHEQRAAVGDLQRRELRAQSELAGLHASVEHHVNKVKREVAQNTTLRGEHKALAGECKKAGDDRDRLQKELDILTSERELNVEGGATVGRNGRGSANGGGGDDDATRGLEVERLQGQLLEATLAQQDAEREAQLLEAKVAALEGKAAAADRTLHTTAEKLQKSHAEMDVKDQRLEVGGEKREQQTRVRCK